MQFFCFRTKSNSVFFYRKNKFLNNIYILFNLARNISFICVQIKTRANLKKCPMFFFCKFQTSLKINKLNRFESLLTWCNFTVVCSKNKSIENSTLPQIFISIQNYKYLSMLINILIKTYLMYNVFSRYITIYFSSLYCFNIVCFINLYLNINSRFFTYFFT